MSRLPEVKRGSHRLLAEAIGYDHTTVGDWREKGMPDPSKDFWGALRWAFEWIDGGRTVDLDARKRWEVARAEKLEIDNLRKRGKLVEFADMRAIAAEVAAIFSGQLSALPSRMANELAGISEPGIIRERLRFEATRIRKACADRLALLGSVSSDGGGGEPSPDKDAGRVGKRKSRATAGKRGARSVSS